MKMLATTPISTKNARLECAITSAGSRKSKSTIQPLRVVAKRPVASPPYDAERITAIVKTNSGALPPKNGWIVTVVTAATTTLKSGDNVRIQDGSFRGAH